MAHLNANLFQAEPVLTRRPTTSDFTASRQILRGAVLALCACLTACSSDTTDRIENSRGRKIAILP